MNHILGQKISITSPKPQTTRYAIKGIWNDEKLQVVFVDTPGYLKPRYEMQKRMIKIWSDAFKDVDLVIFMTDILSFPSDYDKEVLEILSTFRNQKIAVFNKVDLRPQCEQDKYQDGLIGDFDSVHFVSARTGEGIQEMLDDLVSRIPYHEPYYDEDQLSDLPMRFFAREVIREGIFHILEQELPYASAVLIDKYTDTDDKAVIDAVIWLERQSQKIILIGSQGKTLGKIRAYAEQQLTTFVGKPVQVHLWVKINPNWRKKNTSLKELGFD